MAYTQASAELVAINALGWMAQQDDLLMAFLNQTGAGLDDVKARATDPEFLASVLDFLMMNDDWVTGFCDTQNLPYNDVYIIRQSLPGGALPNWT